MGSGKVTVPGVPALGWKTGRECTFIGSLESATKVTEHPWRYSDLMGVSGLAFRVRWSNPDTKGWDLGCPCGEHPEEYAAVVRATGWQLPVDLWDQSHADEMRAKIIASVDAGLPLLTTVGDHDVSVVYGYADEGRMVIVRNYNRSKGPMVCTIGQVGGYQIYLGEHGDPMPARETLIEALRTGVGNWTRGRADGGHPDKEFFYGEAALKSWADDLTKRDPMALSEDDLNALYALNAWNIVSLVDARRAAVRYLRDHAPLFSEKARTHILRAADLYSEEARLLDRAIKRAAIRIDVAAKPVEDWSAEVRRLQADLLVETRRLEDHAIRQMENALIAEGAVPMPSRVVLSAVGRVGFFNGQDSPEDYAVPGVMRSSMQYLGNDCGIKGRIENRGSWQWDVGGLMHGVTGTGFRFKWDSGIGPTEESYLGADLMTMYEHAFRAAGCSYEMILRTDYAAPLNCGARRSDDEQEFRRAIVESIRDEGRPVIAFGVIGPPEPCIITGYDESGDLLIGWNFFQDELKSDPRISFEPSGCFRKRGCFADIGGIILIGESERRPSRKRVYRDALRRGLQTLCFEGTTNSRAGIASYTDWIENLLDDSKYPRDDPDAVKEQVGRVCDPPGDLAERRCFAESFLNQAVNLFPEAKDDLRLAGDHYQVIHDMVYRFWQTQPQDKDGAIDLAAWADPAARRELASIVRFQREKDLVAMALIRQALAKIGVHEGDLPTPPPMPGIADGTREIMPELVRSQLVPQVRFANLDRYVDGVPKFDWWSRNVCSFTASLESAMAATQHSYSYADLMGYSGLAFRTRCFVNESRSQTRWGSLRWHPVSPHGEQAEEVAAISKATGWRLRLAEVRREDQLERTRLTTDAVLSINAGLPVVVSYNTDLGVLYSYHVWNRTFLMRDVQRSDQPEVRIPFDDPRLGSPYVFLTEHRTPMPEREALMESLRIAVRNGYRAQHGDFRFGLGALEAWRDALAGYDGYSEDERGLLFMVNWWCVMHLADARQSAVAFLELHEGLLSGEACERLHHATEIYRQEADLVASFAKANQGFIPWWGGTKPVSDWAPRVREQQIEMLSKAVSLEGAALEQINRVLAHERGNQSEGADVCMCRQRT